MTAPREPGVDLPKDVLPGDSASGGAASDADSTGEMTFLDHLVELRRRLLWACAGVLVGVGVCWAFSDAILSFLLNPIEEAMGQLTVIRPAEAFMNKMKAAFVGGIFVSLPWLLYQAWAFVAPGLYVKERRLFVPVVIVGSGLFVVGAGFCYYIAMPAAIDFLANQGKQFESNVTVDYAFSFATKLILGLGAVFEMPLFVFALARMRVVTARWLFKKIEIALFLCFLAAAILTPTPDVMTMSIFALPMFLLYLISIVVAWAARPRDRKKKSKAEETGGK